MPPLSATIIREKDSREGRSSRRVIPPAHSIVLRCPACGSDGPAYSYESLAAKLDPFVCNACSFRTTQACGIWSALPLERQKYFAQFMQEYEQVRNAEGRGSTSPEFYLALPFVDVTGRNAWQWSIRARTYAYIVRNILPGLSRKDGLPLKVLDLGAGNGWLSYRLACLGHQPVAVDLLTNESDGLGAAIHYQAALPKFFPRFQAELDHLPFACGQYDCAIFNASLHYSENCERTLAEAIRCLCPGGTLIVADTPTYSEEAFGRQMVEERQRSFKERFGFKSDGLKSCEYLTPARLLALEAKLQFEWRVHRVWYGFRWAARPWLSRLKGQREPSQFRVYVAQVKQQ